jgi:hypothetical protein
LGNGVFNDSFEGGAALFAMLISLVFVTRAGGDVGQDDLAISVVEMLGWNRPLAD